MRQHGLTDALTTDHHFEQEGFRRPSWPPPGTPRRWSRYAWPTSRDRLAGTPVTERTSESDHHGRPWRPCPPIPLRAFGFPAFRTARNPSSPGCWPASPPSRSSPPAAARASATSSRRSLLDGLTLVVSPLIALMKDQIDFLTSPRRRRRPARFAASTRPSPGRSTTTSRPGGSSCSTSPPSGFGQRAVPRRRFGQPESRAARRRRGPLHQRVGPQLPPRLPQARRAWRRDLGVGRVLALTATATPAVAARHRRPSTSTTATSSAPASTAPNLELRVTRCRDARASRRACLLERLRSPAGGGRRSSTSRFRRPPRRWPRR